MYYHIATLATKRANVAQIDYLRRVASLQSLPFIQSRLLGVFYVIRHVIETETIVYLYRRTK